MIIVVPAFTLVEVPASDGLQTGPVMRTLIKPRFRELGSETGLLIDLTV